MPSRSNIYVCALASVVSAMPRGERHESSSYSEAFLPKASLMRLNLALASLSSFRYKACVTVLPRLRAAAADLFARLAQLWATRLASGGVGWSCVSHGVVCVVM